MRNDVRIMAHTLNVYFTHNTSRGCFNCSENLFTDVVIDRRMVTLNHKR